ncbi:peptidase M10 [Parafilimonas sp.]|uniref:peptidase M10 n=1 Tax=Parafilimonas sp. TaxID=1969739 RepID=UPI0039E4A546
MLTVRSHIITYGNASDAVITERIRSEIETMWNEPEAVVYINKRPLRVVFDITAEWKPGIDMDEIVMNTDGRNNYFRIEPFAHGNISFVDDIGCNTGYFMLENLYAGSTTAAHEYGHTLGLLHPEDLDIRGRGVPGIMYPRGTLVDAPYQYEPSKPAGAKGGTMHPIYRKVFQSDIDNLKLQRLRFKNNRDIIGAFTNIYHRDHGQADFSSYA